MTYHKFQHSGSVICDVCGKTRNRGKHSRCSKIRQDTENLRAVVYEKFGTQLALAEHLEVSPSYVSEVLNGRRPVPGRIREALQ